MNTRDSETSKGTGPAGIRDEATLIEAAKKGDERAVTALVERYQRKVYGLALGVLRDPEEAMDVAQEVFIRIFRRMESFEGTSSFGTWLYRVTMNLSIDHVRSRKRRHEESFEASEENMNALETMEADQAVMGRVSSDPTEMLDEMELKAKLDRCMSKLPEIHRQVLVLRELEGLSYSDMAKVLEISKGTVMSRLHHAREKLKELMRMEMQGRPSTTRPSRHDRAGAGTGTRAEEVS